MYGMHTRPVLFAGSVIYRVFAGMLAGYAHMRFFENVFLPGMHTRMRLLVQSVQRLYEERGRVLQSTRPRTPSTDERSAAPRRAAPCAQWPRLFVTRRALECQSSRSVVSSVLLIPSAGRA